VAEAVSRLPNENLSIQREAAQMLGRQESLPADVIEPIIQALNTENAILEFVHLVWPLLIISFGPTSGC